MVTVSSRSRMRVVLCWGPSARGPSRLHLAFILALTLSHLNLAEAHCRENEFLMRSRWAPACGRF